MFHILVAEDDRELNSQVCEYLRQSGYEMTGCLDANEALNALYNDLFDLVIPDIMMPGIDGFVFARTIRKTNPEMPILFMTAREFNILNKMLSYPKKTFTRAQLMDEFWNLDTTSTLRTVDVHMTKLREKFAGTDAFEIITVRGFGYKAVAK